MRRCDVCGRKLDLWTALRVLVRPEHATYPFRDVDGERREAPVRALCGGCRTRAERHREQAPARRADLL